MLKSEVQHQFWVTKKVVERRLGTKEDDCIVSSDAELDAKIELFKTISDSCNRLYRIIDQYQERLCILAQEENALGKFLKEAGKNSNTSGKVMICCGKAISYCGQQRMTIRPSLLRLFHEVETFRARAVADTQTTLMSMEKDRTEYRAALSWMKSISSQLDPDTGRNLDKFRKAQAHVRSSKAKFDRLSLDCLQKIDLLAAARCNMFSHALVAYMTVLLQFATKSSETFKATAQALSTSTQYNFAVLKGLAESFQKDNEQYSAEPAALDSDQMLFFQDEYTDENKDMEDKLKETTQLQKDTSDSLIEISNFNEGKTDMQNTMDTITKQIKTDDNKSSLNLSNEFDKFMSEEFNTFSLMPSQLLMNTFPLCGTERESGNMSSINLKQGSKPQGPKSKNSILELFNRSNSSKDQNVLEKSKTCKNNNLKSGKIDSKTNISSWFDVFAELDPLSNPDAIGEKIEGVKSTFQAA